MLSKRGKYAVTVKTIIDSLMVPSYPKASQDGILYLIPFISSLKTIIKEEAKEIISQQLSIVSILFIYFIIIINY